MNSVNNSLTTSQTRFNTLYNKRIQYNDNKEKLRENLLRDQGVSFKPDLSKTKSHASLADGNLIARNEEFLRKKEEKIKKKKLEEEQQLNF